MDQTVQNPFDNIPATARGHFVLYFYSAVFRMLSYLLEQTGGDKGEIDNLLKRYPFLAGYYDELHHYLPKEKPGQPASEWWMQSLYDWEQRCDTHLPLKALRENATLSADSCLAFMLIGLVDEDSRFGDMIGDLQAPLAQRRPTLDLIGRFVAHCKVMSAVQDPWTLCRPLIEAGLIEIINRQSPRSEWIPRVPSLIWDAVRGEVDRRPAAWCHYYRSDSFPDIERLIYPAAVVEQLGNLPGMIEESVLKSLILRSAEGNDVLEVIGAVAKAAGFSVMAVEPNEENEETIGRLLGPLCTLTHSIPVMKYRSWPGETITAPELKCYTGVICLTIGLEGGIESNGEGRSVTMTLPDADHDLRKQYWQRALDGWRVNDLDAVATEFRLSGGYIRRVASMATVNAKLNARRTIHTDDIRQAARALNREHLDTLAERLDTNVAWEQLVCSETTSIKLLELRRRCRYRERLSRSVGGAFAKEKMHGVRALFTGASGTGKTMAAGILAAELGMDIYRVDLAAVINKYIGETEKNLHRLLAQAEALDVMLLLDEGDALLGSRTDVKSANDRYANLETNYLLQRLENYQGIIIITSNLAENIDPAFQRRMDIVTPFPVPRQQERLQIIEVHLPDDHAVAFHELQAIASCCALTGGQIRNAVLHAGLLSLEEECVLNVSHLKQGLASEYAKAGAVFPMVDNPAGEVRRKGDSGMAALVNALADH